jgi:hypothetical protein
MIRRVIAYNQPAKLNKTGQFAMQARKNATTKRGSQGSFDKHFTLLYMLHPTRCGNPNQEPTKGSNRPPCPTSSENLKQSSPQAVLCSRNTAQLPKSLNTSMYMHVTSWQVKQARPACHADGFFLMHRMQYINNDIGTMRRLGPH